MRSVRQLRLAGLIAYLAALVAGLLASGLLDLALGGHGEIGWTHLNFDGFLEGLVFLLIFTLALWVAKQAVRVSATTLLSAGLFGPPSARRFARPIPLVETVESFEGRLAVLREGEAPVGVLGLEDRVVPWDEAPVVSGETAVTELGSLFWRYPIVLVADGNTVYGAIRREAYIKYLEA